MLLRHEAFPALCWRAPYLHAHLLNVFLSVVFTACFCAAVCWCQLIRVQGEPWCYPAPVDHQHGRMDHTHRTQQP